MIVDNYRGNLCSFDGTEYTLLTNSDNLVIGQDLENKDLSFEYLFGIIHFSSPYTYTIPNKKDMIRKLFTPAIHKLPPIRVKTSKITQKKDLYAIVKLEKMENNILLADVVEYIGDKEDVNIQSKFMEYICSCGWKKTKKINSLFVECKNIDLTPNRDNYTHVNIYSIDPKGCLDIDDALHCIYDDTKKEYEIGIHIADVSSFIGENTQLDEELKNRIETIYDYKKNPIHMISEELSISHISLLEQSVKRAFSVIIKAKLNNNKIEIINVKFKKTIIKVKKNLSYEEAQNMLNSDGDIKNLYEIGILLKKEIIFSFSQDEMYDTHQMVAVYMIYANKFAGEFLQKYDDKKVLLRVHKGGENSIVNCGDKILLQKYNLCNKEQARYQNSSINSKHEGLNLNYYTHFTSPIRRYADIIVHRQLWNFINNVELRETKTKTIFLMNYWKKIYKQTERFMKTCEISNLIGDNCIQTDAFIVFINENKNTMRIFVPKFNLDYDLDIIDDKIAHTMNIEVTQNKITFNTKEYELFQKINVKISSSKEKFIKLYFQIL